MFRKVFVLFCMIFFLMESVHCKARGANDGLGKGGGAAAHIKLTPADKAAAVELKDPKAPEYVVVIVFGSPCIIVALVFITISIKSKLKERDEEFCYNRLLDPDESC